jgi:hypothetical protein
LRSCSFSSSHLKSNELSVGYIIGEVTLPARTFVREHDHQYARVFHRGVYFSYVHLYLRI